MPNNIFTIRESLSDVGYLRYIFGHKGSHESSSVGLRSGVSALLLEQAQSTCKPLGSVQEENLLECSWSESTEPGSTRPQRGNATGYAVVARNPVRASCGYERPRTTRPNQVPSAC